MGNLKRTVQISWVRVDSHFLVQRQRDDGNHRQLLALNQPLEYFPIRAGRIETELPVTRVVTPSHLDRCTLVITYVSPRQK